MSNALSDLTQDKPAPKPGDVIVVWVSYGAASAVAAYETIRRYGATCDVRLVIDRAKPFKVQPIGCVAVQEFGPSRHGLFGHGAVADRHKQRHGPGSPQRALDGQFIAGDVGLDVVPCPRVDAVQCHDLGRAIGCILHLLEETGEHLPHAERRIGAPGAPRLHRIDAHLKEVCGLCLGEAADAKGGFEGRHSVSRQGDDEVFVCADHAGRRAHIVVVVREIVLYAASNRLLVGVDSGHAIGPHRIQNSLDLLGSLIGQVFVVRVLGLYAELKTVRSDVAHFRSPLPLAVGQSRRVYRYEYTLFVYRRKPPRQLFCWPEPRPLPAATGRPLKTMAVECGIFCEERPE